MTKTLGEERRGGRDCSVRFHDLLQSSEAHASVIPLQTDKWISNTEEGI